MSNKIGQKEKKESSMWTVGREFTGYLLDLLVCLYMVLVIVVMPFYHQQGFSHIGTDKATFFKQLSITSACLFLPVLVVYLLFLLGEKRMNFAIKLSWTDRFALVYGVALLLSYLCSDYKENALWGAGGWYMGLLPQLILLAIYFLVSRFWEFRKWQIFLFLPVSAVVFGLGYLNRFGVFPIDMKINNPEFISTIGNINWYCGYLVSVFFAGFYLLWQSNMENSGKFGWKRILLMVYVAVGFATLVTQGSMSGLVTLAVILVFTFCFSVKEQKRMLLFWQEVLLLSLMCLLTYVGRTVLHWQITYTGKVVDFLTNSPLAVVMAVISVIMVITLFGLGKKENYPVKLFALAAKAGVVTLGLAGVVLVILIVANTLHPGCIGALSEYSFFTVSPTWGSNRATTWKAGFMCFWEQNLLHKILGVGPDSMSAYIYQAGSEDLKETVKNVFGDATLTNAHNEWLTVMVNEGLLGFVGFVGMMVSAIGRFLKAGLRSGQVVLGACGFCLLAYTINNMFSFQQSMSAATIFVILGMGEAYARSMRLFFVYE